MILLFLSHITRHAPSSFSPRPPPASSLLSYVPLSPSIFYLDYSLPPLYKSQDAASIPSMASHSLLSSREGHNHHPSLLLAESTSTFGYGCSPCLLPSSELRHQAPRTIGDLASPSMVTSPCQIPLGTLRTAPTSHGRAFLPAMPPG